MDSICIEDIRIANVVVRNEPKPIVPILVEEEVKNKAISSKTSLDAGTGADTKLQSFMNGPVGISLGVIKGTPNIIFILEAY